MKKRLFAAFLAGALTAAVSVVLSGCGKNVTININDNNNTLQAIMGEDTDAVDGEEDENAESEKDEGVYTSDDGWSVTFDPSDFAVNEDDKGVSFVYQGESAGTNMVTISYKKDAQPEAVLDELTSGWGDEVPMEKSESYFPGTNDKWGFWRSLSGSTEGSGLSERAYAGEYNGGTLLFEYITHSSGDTEADRPANTALQDLVDSITYDDFEDQEMFKDYPGVYVREYTEEMEGEEMTFTESVTLNKDHSGTISLQDDLYVMWGKNLLIMADASYDYSVDGDTLTIMMDDDTIEFTRQGDAAEEQN